MCRRFGFPLAFLDRQKVLAHLAVSLPLQDKLHLGKEVDHIQPVKNRLRVHSRDGSFYDGDLVVGADGVHSMVRVEMWRLAKEAKDPRFSSLNEKESKWRSKSHISGRPCIDYPFRDEHRVRLCVWNLLAAPQAVLWSADILL